MSWNCCSTRIKLYFVHNLSSAGMIVLLAFFSGLLSKCLHGSPNKWIGVHFHFVSIVSMNCIFPMVEKHVDLVRFRAFALCASPFAWIYFTQYQAKQNLSTKSHTRAATHPLVTNHMGWVLFFFCVYRKGNFLSSGTCHIFENEPAKFACPLHCGCNFQLYTKQR